MPRQKRFPNSDMDDFQPSGVSKRLWVIHRPKLRDEKWRLLIPAESMLLTDIGVSGSIESELAGNVGRMALCDGTCCCDVLSSQVI